MRLNDEQRKLVEDNHDLIYWYANKGGLALGEWYDLLAITLCYSALKYNPNKGAFSTYFKLRADGMVSKEYRKHNTQKRYNNNIPYIENAHFQLEPDNPHMEFELKEMMESENGDIIRMKYEGYTQTEMAQKLGLSQSYVSKIIRKLRDEYEGIDG